ncbi:MAG: GAF and ANTAR domain-containing protein [Pseudonocardiaceae bacterium]
MPPLVVFGWVWCARLGTTEGALALWTLPLRRSWRMNYHAGRRITDRRIRSTHMPEKIPPALGPALSELAGLLLTTESFTDLVQGVAELAVHILEPVVTCGITLSEQGRIFTVAAADELANQLDERQYELGVGPCLSALTIGETLYAPDLRVEDRWGDYSTMAMGHGILSVYSVPLIVEGKPLGVLNLYARNPNAFGPQDQQLAALLAGQAAIAVTAALRHYDEVTLADHLRTALASRSVIDQAIGIIMAQQHSTPEQAFTVLRTISQRRNIKLRVVATELVETISRIKPGRTSS